MNKNTVTVQELIQFIPVSERRIRQLVKQGVIPSAKAGKYPLVICIQSYANYLRSYINERQAQSPASLNRERIRLTRAQADKAQAEYEQLCREWIPLELADTLYQDLDAMLKKILFTLPERGAKAIQGLTEPAQVKAALQVVSREVQAQMAARVEAYRLETLPKLVPPLEPLS